MMQKGDRFNKDFLVSDAVYQQFIQLFDDKNPLHTDSGFAQSKGFADKVMHGNILNGFVSYFVGEMLPIKNVIIQTQEIKFSLPVYANQTLKFVAEIVEIYESVNAVEIKYQFENPQGKKVAKGKVQIGII